MKIEGLYERSRHSQQRSFSGRGFGGALKGMTAPELGVRIAQEAIQRSGVEPEHFDETIIGHGWQAGVGPNSARLISVGAGLPNETPRLHDQQALRLEHQGRRPGRPGDSRGRCGGRPGRRRGEHIQRALREPLAPGGGTASPRAVSGSDLQGRL